MPNDTAAAIDTLTAKPSDVHNLILCDMKNLFEPCQAGALQLASRIVMAPLTRNRAPNAMPNALMAEYYAQRANPATGAGLIITEATAISHQGQGYADVPGIWSTEQVNAWQAITQGVHAKGGKIVMQLWHVGRISHTSLQPGGQAPVAPSAITAKSKTVLIVDGVPSFVPTSEPRALRLDELPGIVDDYRKAARNAIAAGFDGVEVHAANGYLIDQFLRADSNHRTDAYGGSIENRARSHCSASMRLCRPPFGRPLSWLCNQKRDRLVGNPWRHPLSLQ